MTVSKEGPRPFGPGRPAPAEILGRFTARLGVAEDRPGQRQLAGAVGRLVEAGGVLVAQAGTGVGKSFAYLSGIVSGGRKAVIATATLALQDQLMKKDLPVVSSAAPGLSFASVKGRSNYLCLAKFEELQDDLVVDRESRVSPQAVITDLSPVPAREHARESGTGSERRGRWHRTDAAEISHLSSWVGSTATGDRDEIEGIGWELWSRVSVSPNECPGARLCKSGRRCFAERARRDAEDADIVVTNLYVYAYHLLTDAGSLLPAHDVLVVDEAHELPDVVSRVFGVSSSTVELVRLADMAHRAARRRRGAVEMVVGAAQRVRDSAVNLALALDSFMEGAEAARGRSAFLLPGTKMWPVAVSALEDAKTSVEGLLLALGEVTGSEAQGTIGTVAPRGDLEDGRYERVRVMAEAQRSALGELSRADIGENEVAVAELAASGAGGTVYRQTVDPGEVLQRWFWPAVTERGERDSGQSQEGAEPGRAGMFAAEPESGPGERTDGSRGGEGEQHVPRSVVLTSATIPLDLAARLALPDPAHIDAGSPFDYSRQMLLYVPGAPFPIPSGHSRDAWTGAIKDEIAALLAASEGRALALFTSKAVMQLAGEHLKRNLPRAVSVYLQGDSGRASLVKRFADEEHSVLLGTRSFFQGIDVPGPSLSLVVLDKLPFPRIGDPLVEARGRRAEKAGGSAFAQVSLPDAATTLAQAIGRLVRSASDSGVACVLDRRLCDSSYGKRLLGMLPFPGLPVSRDRAAVVSRLRLSLSGDPNRAGKPD